MILYPFQDQLTYIYTFEVTVMADNSEYNLYFSHMKPNPFFFFLLLIIIL